MNERKMRQTEEEAEKYKKEILEASQIGLPVRRMRANFGISEYYIKKIREKLIAEGLITKKEIDEAYNRYIAENPTAQGLDKSKARVKANPTREYAKTVYRKEKVLEMINNQKTIIEIAIELKVSKVTICKYIRQLRKEGRLEKIEIDKLNSNDSSIYIDKESSEYLEKRKQILKYLKLGWKNNTIRKKLDINSTYMNIYLKDIEDEKLITPEKIENARVQKKLNDLKTLTQYIKEGYTIKYFSELHPEFSYGEVILLTEELIKVGEVTKQQIEKNRKNSIRKTLNEDEKMSPEEVDFIIDKVKKGYTPKEIIESDEKKSLTMSKVLYQKRLMIEQGIISLEEAKQKIKERQNEDLNKEFESKINKIIEYIKQGYTVKEIGELLEYSGSYIYKLIDQYSKENKWFSRKEIKEFREQRKIREYETLSQEEKDKILKEKQEQTLKLEREKEQRKEKRKEQKKAEILERRKSKQDKTNEKHQKEIEQIKQYILEGKTVIEIAKIMGTYKNYIYFLQRESKANGTWISDDEIEKVNKKRKKRKEEAKQKRHEEKEENKIKKQQEKEQLEQKNMEQLRDLAVKGFKIEEIAKQMNYSIAYINILKRKVIKEGRWFSKKELELYKKRRIKEESKAEIERQKEEQKRLRIQQKEAEIAKKKEEENLKRIEKEKKRSIRVYEQEYKKLKKAAKKEDKMELNGEDNVSQEGRKQFVDLLIKLYNNGEIISKEDISIVLDTIYMHNEFTNKNNLKLLIGNAIRSNGLVEAENMITHLMSDLRGTKYYNALSQYKKWIKIQRLIPQIKELKKRGWNNEKIAKELGISSAEVAVYQKETDKNVDFFGEEDGR